jgi:hypothetical protein
MAREIIIPDVTFVTPTADEHIAADEAADETNDMWLEDEDLSWGFDFTRRGLGNNYQASKPTLAMRRRTSARTRTLERRGGSRATGFRRLAA